jgi:hypothetical protein
LAESSGEVGHGGLIGGRTPVQIREEVHQARHTLSIESNRLRVVVEFAAVVEVEAGDADVGVLGNLGDLKAGFAASSVTLGGERRVVFCVVIDRRPNGLKEARETSHSIGAGGIGAICDHNCAVLVLNDVLLEGGEEGVPEDGAGEVLLPNV